MQVAFKGRRLGEFVWNRELLPGAEWTAGQWEKMAGCKQRPGTASKEEAGLSRPSQGSRGLCPRGREPWEASL